MSTLDPRTTLIIATLLMLLVGGVLGFMHRSLSPDMRPSAVDWRIGTLLLAGGAILQAFQQSLPPGFILPIANGCILLGVTLYWRAVRRFHGERDRWWLFLPVALAVPAIYWFAAVVPNYAARIVAFSIAMAIQAWAMVWILYRRHDRDSATSHRVLAALFAIIGAFMVFRVVYFAVYPVGATNVLDSGHWLNAITPVIMLVMPVVGTTTFLVLCLERIRGQWERAAATDYLTGLPNRRTITGAGQARFAAARRAGRSFAVAVIDIDHFKSINDRYGHEAGDDVLKHVALTLERCCRGPNMVGRQGGEEFVALFEDVDGARARIAAERVRHAVEISPATVRGTSLTVTASVGLGIIAPGDHEFDDVLRRADHAVYAAKQAGRNRVETHEL